MPKKISRTFPIDEAYGVSNIRLVVKIPRKTSKGYRCDFAIYVDKNKVFKSKVFGFDALQALFICLGFACQEINYIAKKRGAKVDEIFLKDMAKFLKNNSTDGAI